jgi:hypothetical protein
MGKRQEKQAAKIARAAAQSAHRPDQFLDEVFPAELGEIRARRGRLAELADSGAMDRGDVPRTDLPADSLPGADLGLVGLGLSGGGIRSACFNLGVIQSLVGNRVMPRIDYVSTVSGGGYIGTCLDALLTRPHVRPTPEALPLHFDSRHARQADLRTGQPGSAAYSEPPALRHLRDGARYLAPGGLMDLVVIPFLLLRGLVVNLFALLSYTGAVAALGILAFVGLHAMWPSVGPDGSPRWNLPLVESVLGLALLALLTGTLLLEFRRKLRGPGRESVRRWIAACLVAIAFAAAFVAQPWVVAWFWGWFRRPDSHLPSWLTGAGAVGVLLQAASFVKRPPAWARVALLTLMGLLGPLLMYAFLLGLCGWLWFGPEDPGARSGWPGAPAVGWWDRAGPAFVVIAVVNAVVVSVLDINRSSMMFFYRDRLSRLFLFRTFGPEVDGKGFNEVDQVGCDDLRLTDLSPRGSVGPYRLINAAVNLQGSQDKSLRGRSADFFLFSKHFVGSPRTGYCSTRRLEEEDGDLDLATATAISAAAAAPNMGSATFRPLVFVMTLLNVRLGYWLPNPSQVRQAKPRGERTPIERVRQRQMFTVGLGYLARELFSRLDERSNVVNVTDGGHIENLGVYELLRRRCRVIIACDAEADPGLEFPSLSRVIRFARTDMGIDINLDVDPIRLSGNGDPAARHHWAVGEIRYPGGFRGWLVYIKSTLVGSENLYVRQQRSEADPAFPHTPTSDQFFSEAQFECYRSLGFHACNRAFEAWAARAERSATPEWVKDLERC